MRKRTAYRPAAWDVLEDRIVLDHGWGGVLTAAEVFQANLSRSQIRDIIAGQMRGAFSQFSQGFAHAMDSLTASGSRATFDHEVAGLGHALAARCGEVLSTSPRAASSLVPFIQESLVGSNPNCLTAQLANLHVPADNPAELLAFQREAFRIITAAQRTTLGGLHTFAQNPNFAFPHSGTAILPPTHPTPPAAPPPPTLPPPPPPTEPPPPTLPPEPTRAELLTPLQDQIPPGADPHDPNLLAMHIHPRLTIRILGQEHTIPADVGISSAGMLPIHTHDETGVLHVESVVLRTFRLRHFFEIWRTTTGDPNLVFTRQNILGHQVDAHRRIVMTVDDQPNDEFEELILRDGQRIVIEYI